jgi:carboxypeptidase Taq
VLREWVDLRKKICALVEPTKPAYDVCIDRFERGMTAQRFDEIFSEVRAPSTQMGVARAC